MLATWDAEDGHHVEIIPEPATMSLMAIAGIAMLPKRKRRTR
ncbi:MAG: PEP-CTERM sorting domain-containing protein [Phycisphaerae bacterium]|jgi:hypothetical protein|nr:PEP-CTERM sorting domain-containing protein [Phycisphaerae bacterium]